MESIYLSADRSLGQGDSQNRQSKQKRTKILQMVQWQAYDYHVIYLYAFQPVWFLNVQKYNANYDWW